MASGAPAETHGTHPGRRGRRFSEGRRDLLLIANTSVFAGDARVRLYFEDGTSAERTFALAPRSRTNVSVSVEFPAAASPGGVTWAAGTNALATPVP